MSHASQRASGWPGGGLNVLQRVTTGGQQLKRPQKCFMGSPTLLVLEQGGANMLFHK